MPGGESRRTLPQGAVIAGLTPQWGSAIATGLCMLLHVVCFLGKLFLSIWLQLRKTLGVGSETDDDVW